MRFQCSKLIYRKKYLDLVCILEVSVLGLGLLNTDIHTEVNFCVIPDFIKALCLIRP